MGMIDHFVEDRRQPKKWTKAEIGDEWEDIADRIEAILPHLSPVERHAPSQVVEAYRAKAKRLRSAQ